MKISRLYLFLMAFVALVPGLWATDLYPKCWIKYGECLDQNKGPLLKGVKPQINQNIVGESISNITSLDDCVSECVKNPDCGYFTYYAKPIDHAKRNLSDCQLVGFNLRQACFNLENTCVLLKNCQIFNSTCSSCKTGIRPLVDPKEEKLTVILNGLTDDRNFKATDTPQYSETKASISELIVNSSKTCELKSLGLKPRYGSAAGFINGKIINCGGYSNNESQYLDICQHQTAKDQDWEDTASALNVKRAFASSVVVPKTDDDTEVLYLMGGYNSDDGFLDSVEKYDSTGDTWSVATPMAEPKSHFCAVMASPNVDGERFVYTIGGWNIDYLNVVHRMSIAPDGTGTTWTPVSGLKVARSDHACAEVQMGWDKGIMVAGGYRKDGAWLSSIEFYIYDKGDEWQLIDFLPYLVNGRHNHGFTTLSMKPAIFGGWNNGSMNSIELLNDCKTPKIWEEQTTTLLERRERFATVRIPKSFAADCSMP